ncbi:RNA 2',3'-cyclic phosphodiesterase [Actinoplanes sp. CA-142083]|uniref:RNA 2',3'-cyclic phosphodiesterase n=1 Tax=Actinoplanes sp. CA-142083 TaxID=3239903 RepID=UPI003D90798D
MGRCAVRWRSGGSRVVLTRLFVAVFPPSSAVEPLRACLPAGAKLTRPSQWHVTLVFLGEAQPDEVAAALDTVPAQEPFSLRLAGGGRFGTAAWAGVSGDVAALGALQVNVRNVLGRNDRPYRPHLTVSYRNDREVQAALAGFAGDEWIVDEFALVNSHDGKYETLRTWPLRPPAGRGPSRASG